MIEGVITELKVEPRRIILYGVGGIGKSTWAAMAPDVIFVQCEDGLSDIPTKLAHRFPLSTSFDGVMANLQKLHQGQHQYKAIAVDSGDWLEKLIWKKVCEDKHVANIEDIGYAKGYQFAIDYWRQFVDALNWLRRDRQMMAIIIVHSQVVRFEDPMTESYDRYILQLNKHANALLVQWADEVLFATYKKYTKAEAKGFNQERAIAVGTGERVVYTTERPSHIAKNRLGLPEELPLVWAEYAKYLPQNVVKKETSNVG